MVSTGADRHLDGAFSRGRLALADHQIIHDQPAVRLHSALLLSRLGQKLDACLGRLLGLSHRTLPHDLCRPRHPDRERPWRVVVHQVELDACEESIELVLLENAELAQLVRVR